MVWKRTRKKNRHHNLAKERGGLRTIQNLIELDERRHQAFHLIFGNRTFSEAARILIRAERMKEDYCERMR